MRRPRTNSAWLVLGLALPLVALLLAQSAPLSGQEPPARPTQQAQADFEYVAALDELTDAHARVFRLYWAYFDRQPDANGAMYWISRLEQCVGLRSIGDFFTDSPEFAQTYGELDNDAFITLVYRNVLDRRPDPNGLEYWKGQLEGGLIDRTRLMLDFSFSAEFVAQHPLPSDDVPSRPCAGSVTPSGAAQEFELQDWEPYATVGPLELVHPSAAVAVIGYHESSHDGAQQQNSAATDTPWLTMDSRGRGTLSRSAADIAVHPMFEIRAPVTGTVLRAGSYVLYCQFTDGFLVVEPDDRPGWEVKMLHITDVRVEAGDRVVAGRTTVATGATLFPFRSQIDSATAEPSWGHVHIEVVDPSIPDRPSAGSC